MSNIDWGQLVTAEQRANEALAIAWDDLRVERDRRLDITDKIVRRHEDELALDLVPTLTAEQYGDLLVYRQALRDLPENTVDPASPVWPQNPALPA